MEISIPHQWILAQMKIDPYSCQEASAQVKMELLSCQEAFVEVDIENQWLSLVRMRIHHGQ